MAFLIDFDWDPCKWLNLALVYPLLPFSQILTRHLNPITLRFPHLSPPPTISPTPLPTIFLPSLSLGPGGRSRKDKKEDKVEREDKEDNYIAANQRFNRRISWANQSFNRRISWATVHGHSLYQKPGIGG